MSEDLKQESVASNELLGSIESELSPVFAKLHELRNRCEAGNESRIAFEISQGIRTLSEALTLIKLYRSGVKLPTLGEMRGILKRAEMVRTDH